MKNIVNVENEELFVSLQDIAKYSEVKYTSVQNLIVRKKKDFEKLGLRIPKEYDFKSLLLNEPQTTLLMISLRSSKVVDNFRLNLVMQFYKMKEELKNVHKIQIEKKDTQLKESQKVIKSMSERAYAKRRDGDLQTVTRIISDYGVDIKPSELNVLLVKKGLLTLEVVEIFSFESKNMSGKTPLVHINTVLDILEDENIAIGVEDAQQTFTFN